METAADAVVIGETGAIEVAEASVEIPAVVLAAAAAADLAAGLQADLAAVASAVGLRVDSVVVDSEGLRAAVVP